MKSFTKLTLAAFALMLFFNAFAVVETKAQGGGVLNEILKRMEDHRKSLTSLRADVKMVKTDVLLDESDIYEGTVYYLPAKGRDALIRIDWTKPNKETLAVKNKKYILWQERLQQAIVGSAANAKGNGKANNLFAFLNMSKAELKANYSIRYMGEEGVSGSVSTWHLQMTPKNKTSYKSADMWVNKDGMPVQIKITAGNNDTTAILLSGLKKNVTIDAGIFTVDLPKGTKIIEG